MSLTGKTTGKTLRGNIKAIKTIRGYSAYEIALLNGFSGTEEEWLKSLEVNPAAVAEAVNAYLKENPTSVDDTLSKSGEAADAKVTGDNFTRVDGEISAVRETVESIANADLVAHEHSADDVTSGILPPERGGTGKNTLADALVAMLASGDIILTSRHAGTDFPADAPNGKFFLKKVT